ncbi:abortive infection protein [Bacillus coahuilensis m2-6]|uniref:CPBP family intramembrane glutamic endopeptidase n=1 Tax=Bacillus coahuilensis TaxID=408580 RepID=UPI0002E97EC7|nr:type II CAAX endopeptidase family protein [Bacillus coahuilensis]KUP04330.1 abortive infection protein [Bacillus coahuilensis m2-6]
MKKNHWFILLTYIVMQLSSIVGYPIFLWAANEFFTLTPKDASNYAIGYWVVTSFTIALIIVLLLLRKSEKDTLDERSAPMSAGLSILVAILGIPAAFIAQAIAITIETAIGVPMGSENTQNIMELIQKVPLVLVTSSLLGPILEEIVFRKIVFSALYKRMPLGFAAILSSVIFGLAHFELNHLLLYTMMGMVFALLYALTKRILVPIFAHVAMNTLVAVVQLNPEWIEQLEELERQNQAIQSIIGGLF